MKRGIIFSLLLHGALLLLLAMHIPPLPQPKLNVIQVKIVQVSAKKTPKKKIKAKSTTKIKPVKTQASTAPKEAPKLKAKPKPKTKPKATAKMVPAKNPKAKKIPEPKEVKAKTNNKNKELAQKRPPKLDKTPNKKIIKNNHKEAKHTTKPDDFMAALNFIDNLKEEPISAKKKQDKEQPRNEQISYAYSTDNERALITRHIEAFWFRPAGLKDMDKMKTLIEVRLNPDGTLAAPPVIIKKSGNFAYDESLLRAVRKAIPIPIPIGKYDDFKELDLYFSG